MLGACDWLTVDREPEEVRVEINSSDVSSVKVVTSMFFLFVPNAECPEDPNCEPQIQLQEADTTTTSLPLSQTFKFNSRYQFFVEAFLPDGLASGTLSMRVMIDDRTWYDDFRQLFAGDGEADPETLRFVYQFDEVTVDDLIGTPQ